MHSATRLVIVIAVSLLVPAAHAQAPKASPNATNNAKSGGSANANANLSGTGNVPANNNNSNGGKTADGDWANLIALTTPVSPPAGASKTPCSAPSDRSQQIAQSRQVAQAARDFSVQHPSDSRVTQARKIEAISGVRGVQNGDVAQAQAAVATARVFRADVTVPAKDRFEVALALYRQDLSGKVAARTVPNIAVEEKKLVENWRQEFGDLPEIETYAAGVARRADPATAAALASQVARSPVAPAAAKAEAKAIRGRARLLGAPLNLKVPQVDGGELDLAVPNGKVTLLVVWTPGEPDSLEPLEAFSKNGLPRDAQIVYLAVGGTAGEMKSARRAVPTKGIQAHLPAGTAASAAITALSLRSAPYIYVLNRAGALSDFGPLTELPALLRRAGIVRAKTS